jgi:hypothetical protein
MIFPLNPLLRGTHTSYSGFGLFTYVFPYSCGALSFRAEGREPGSPPSPSNEPKMGEAAVAFFGGHRRTEARRNVGPLG